MQFRGRKQRSASDALVRSEKSARNWAEDNSFRTKGKDPFTVIVSGLFNFRSSCFSLAFVADFSCEKSANRETSTTERKGHFVTRKRLVERTRDILVPLKRDPLPLNSNLKYDAEYLTRLLNVKFNTRRWERFVIFDTTRREPETIGSVVYLTGHLAASLVFMYIADFMYVVDWRSFLIVVFYTTEF